ncbi:citrate synthase [Devosia sp. CN2-171]|uniref:citrate synthase n=1 Tax=Devosia sp. CN2-171 TaxID=3400909 RepID=UPI003BF7FDEC
MWLSAADALARLGSKPQSLYANVSRGRIRAKPDPSDSRRSLYREEDVDRVAHRSRGRRSAVATASEAISWGEPVLASAISTVSGGRLYYRGKDATELAEDATLEDIAELLWGTPYRSSGQPIEAQPSIQTLLSALAARISDDPSSAGRGTVLLREDALSVFATALSALAGRGQGPAHIQLAAAFGRPDAADALRRALVLLADHELNASTFAARVTVSTGAALSAGALAGLAALGGPRHGNAAPEVLALAEDIDAHPEAAEEALRDWLGERRAVPGFGHPLYPRGDIRCRALLAAIDLPPAFVRLAEAGRAILDEEPNVDFALAVLASAYDLPREAPATIFALARSVGWLAHGIEQATSGQLIRPRARYVGPPIVTAS